MTKSFQPLLSATCDDISKLRYPVLASPKLDGIRCVKIGGRALTRKLKPVPNKFVREWIEANLPDGIDGEIMLRDHRTPFNEVSSAIMSRDGEPEFTFWAFDYLPDADQGAPFERRLDNLEVWVRRRDNRGSGIGGQMFLPRPAKVEIVPHYRCEGEHALRFHIEQDLAAGFEGTMVRDPNGRYKFGRSTVKEGILLKIKPWHDEEATVIGVVEQMHNTNEATLDERGYTKRSSAKEGKVGTGKLGALVCRTEDGVEFEIGTGFTDEQRTEYWENYLMLKDAPTAEFVPVKFKHLGRLPSGAPRCPVFLGWRED